MVQRLEPVVVGDDQGVLVERDQPLGDPPGARRELPLRAHIDVAVVLVELGRCRDGAGGQQQCGQRRGGCVIERRPSVMPASPWARSRPWPSSTRRWPHDRCHSVSPQGDGHGHTMLPQDVEPLFWARMGR